MNGFWNQWMLTWCGATLVFGALLAGAAFPATEGPAALFYAVIGAGEAAIFDPPAMRLTIGVLGAVLIGWALTILGMVRAAKLLGGAPVWRALTFAVTVWYAIDSAISVAVGFPLNALSNTVFLVTFLVPVLGAGVLRSDGPPARA